PPLVDRDPTAPRDGTLHHPRDAGRRSPWIAVWQHRLRPVADDPDLLQSKAIPYPGPDLPQRRVLLRLQPSLLSLYLGLAARGRHPDDAGRRRALYLTCGVPESPTAGARYSPSLSARRGLRGPARGPLPARPVGAVIEQARIRQRRRLCGRRGAHSGLLDHDGADVADRGRTARQRLPRPARAASRGGGRLAGRRLHPAGGVSRLRPALPGRPQRARPGDAVHQERDRIYAPGLWIDEHPGSAI